jgi:hypothetical protein
LKKNKRHGVVCKIREGIDGMTAPTPVEKIAKEMLEEAVSHWRGVREMGANLGFQVTNVGGEINLLLKFPTPYGPTTVSFNPQATVEEFVRACQRRLERTDLWANESLREDVLRAQVKGSISIMLMNARMHFEDALGELPLIVNTLYECCLPLHERKSAMDTLLTRIIERKKARFNMRGRGRERKVTKEKLYYATEILDGNPSQAAVARVIGVSPKRIREWRQKQGFARWEDFLIAVREGRK